MRRTGQTRKDSLSQPRPGHHGHDNDHHPPLHTCRNTEIQGYFGGELVMSAVSAPEEAEREAKSATAVPVIVSWARST
jgi:hypothetical protein